MLELRRFGRDLSYADAHAEQERLVTARIAGEVSDILVLAEHEPVVTVGRKANRAAVAGVDVPVFEIERGGDATYHGPGQLVVYPIQLLPEGRRDLHRYLRDLEEVVLRVLAEFDVEGRREPGETGVWVGDKKICSVGVAVRRWVTWHGFALNVHTDLSAFETFRPCGLDPGVMTRLVDLADIGPGLTLAEVLCVKHFCEVFGQELPPPPPLAEPQGAGCDPRLPLFPG